MDAGDRRGNDDRAQVQCRQGGLLADLTLIWAEDGARPCTQRTPKRFTMARIG